MLKTSFSRSALRDRLAECKFDGWMYLLNGRIYDALVERFGARLVYGRQIPLDLFLEQFPASPPVNLSTARAPLVVFKSQNRSWEAMAVFEAVTCKPNELQALFSFYEEAGVEYVPIPAAHIEGGYLDTPDFRVRCKRAVFAPCRVPFRKYPTLDTVACTLKKSS